VHGDTVNTASRIEGLTKSAGCAVLAAESTRDALLRPPDDLAFVGDFDVRGRQSRIRLWTLAS
jgi:class 3 adenylate cyclase